ncbi:glucokinase [Sphingomonas sp. R86521]|uniref:glucokinase n=1 Tax=Sphingomonas sp. R86521 TaxID=3093860 RepID=UPI0036D3DE4E
MEGTRTAASDGAVLATIGRKRIGIALSDADGALRTGTIRNYDTEATTGVTAALLAFQQDLQLTRLPTRSAIAVAGLVRGDAISITNTRWFLSRSGLQAMLGEPPLILNDFAAEAWAIGSAPVRADEAFGSGATPAIQAPGCYAVIGITSGLGVAVVNRVASGAMTVLPTEAGHGAFAAATPELAAIAADLFPGRHPAAEELVSARGLVAIHNRLAQQRGGAAPITRPEDVTRSAANNPVARAACELLAKAFWAQASSLVMTFGAWDGLVVTGALANAIRPFLRRPDAQALFVASAKHQRTLQAVPRVFATVDNAELIGLAQALRNERS